MFRRPVIISGIPIDPIPPDLAVNEVFRLIDEYREDGVPKQVATVNVDFVVNTLDWSLTTTRHPELLDILRQCDLVTADGMPIVWLSRLLGNGLPGRVTGADLVPALARRAALTGKSLYFLGGKGDVGQQAAEFLAKENPGLKISGVAAPFVHTEGPNLRQADTDDEPIVTAINAARPDILLIAFGNPKQELWYSRNRHRLKVPVAIGIGGTFEFITGRVSRAPLWVQNSGLEWIYRIVQEPGRLWKRYFVGLFKYCSLVLPSILFYLVRRRSGSHPERTYIGTAGEHGDWAMVCRLPGQLDEASATFLEARIGLAKHDHPVILDCRDFRHADCAGLGFLVELRRHCMMQGRLVLFAETGFRFWWYLTVNRLIDLFGPLCFPSVAVAEEYLRTSTATRQYCRVRPRSDGTVALSFPGRLDLFLVKSLDVDSIGQQINGKSGVIDLEETTFIDSAGIIFLFELSHRIRSRGNSCQVRGAWGVVATALRMAKVEELLVVAPSTDERGMKP